MRRAVIVWAGLGLLLAAAGCTMCAHPYDYCGPVVDGSCACPCDTRVRTGSVLSGAVGGGEQMAVEPVAGQELLEQGDAGPTIIGTPATAQGEVIQDGAVGDEQPVIAPVPAGARRYPRTRQVR